MAEHRDLLSQRHDLGARAIGFEFHDASDALDVHTGRGEIGDPTKSRDIGLAVTTISTSGARRLQESATLVDTESLRVHTRELGRHRDHVHGLIATRHDPPPAGRFHF